MTVSQSTPRPEEIGEQIEEYALERLPSLSYVSDLSAEWHDAITDSIMRNRPSLEFQGSAEYVATDTPVEIKAAQRRIAGDRRGRFYLRQGQHQRLVAADAAYLFCVYDPDTLEILAMTAVSAHDVDKKLPDGWVDVGDYRSTRGFRQLSWSNFVAPSRVPAEN